MSEFEFLASEIKAIRAEMKAMRDELIVLMNELKVTINSKTTVSSATVKKAPAARKPATSTPAMDAINAFKNLFKDEGLSNPYIARLFTPENLEDAKKRLDNDRDYLGASEDMKSFKLFSEMWRDRRSALQEEFVTKAIELNKELQNENDRRNTTPNTKET